jgi:hypothetical protein
VPADAPAPFGVQTYLGGALMSLQLDYVAFPQVKHGSSKLISKTFRNCALVSKATLKSFK